MAASQLASLSYSDHRHVIRFRLSLIIFHIFAPVTICAGHGAGQISLRRSWSDHEPVQFNPNLHFNTIPSSFSPGQCLCFSCLFLIITSSSTNHNSYFFPPIFIPSIHPTFIPSHFRPYKRPARRSSLGQSLVRNRSSNI